MKSYKPSLFNFPMKLFSAKEKVINGILKKEYNYTDLIYVSFKTFGGTETENNGVYSVIDTAQIETWYRPDISSNSILETVDGKRYEVIGEPENINMRNQFIKFKIRSVRGGA